MQETISRATRKICSNRGGVSLGDRTNSVRLGLRPGAEGEDAMGWGDRKVSRWHGLPCGGSEKSPAPKWLATRDAEAQKKATLSWVAYYCKHEWLEMVTLLFYSLPNALVMVSVNAREAARNS